MDKKRKYEELSTKLQQKKAKLSEGIGQLNMIKQQAKERFGTDSIDTLTKMKTKYIEEKSKLETQIDDLEDKLEKLLSEIEDE